MKTVWSCLLLATALVAGPTLVDRVAVTVANQAITESRIVEEIRLTAFLNAEAPKLDAASRRAAADRLVERILLRREIEITGFATGAVDSDEDLLADIRGRSLDEAAFQRALVGAQLTQAKLLDNVREQARLLRFIDFRFRPAVSVEEKDERGFYETEYPAFWMALHPNQPLPPFEEARDDVERLLVDRKVDAEMDAWLVTARAQVRVTYREEAFRE
jgi:hypothetical protein